MLAIISKPVIRIRDDCSLDSNIIMDLKNKTLVNIVEQTPLWYRIDSYYVKTTYNIEGWKFLQTNSYIEVPITSPSWVWYTGIKRPWWLRFISLV